MKKISMLVKGDARIKFADLRSMLGTPGNPNILKKQNVHQACGFVSN
jgi:hypothetical protein